MAALPFQNEITDAYLNGDAAFTSASTIYRTLKRAAKQANPNATENADYPSRGAVKDALSTIDIAQTTRPYKVHPADYDSVVARDRGPARQGNRRFQVILDLAIFDRWWKSNRLRTADSKAQSFLYAAVFIDVWSRAVVAYPMQDKKTATLTRVVKQAYEWFGGFENLTVDGESALNTAADNVDGTKAWASQLNPPVRVWINETPSRGKGSVYLVERVIRTIKERLYKRARSMGDRAWAMPVGGAAYWAANPPLAAAALGLPANATLPQRKRRVISSDPRLPSPLQETVRQYNLSTHSSLKTTPADVFLNGAVPLYYQNFLAAGLCTQGSACTSQARRGIRKRDITSRFKVGDNVRLLKSIRDFGKRSELKVWTAGIWRVVADDFPNGLAKYDAGPNPNIPIKGGFGRRFIVQKVGGTERRQAMHWQLKKVPSNTVVVVPDASVHAKMAPLGQPAAKLTSFETAPIKLDGTKAQAGRRGQRFTAQAEADAATARARRAEDIDIDVDAEPDDTPVQTRAASAPIATRAGRRTPLTTATPKPTKKSKPQKRSFQVGDKVKARYDGTWWFGTVIEETDGGVDVSFPKDGSVALFEAPKYAGLRMVKRGT